MKLSFSVLSFLLATGVASASITIDFQLARAFTAGGAAQVAPGTIGVLVADTFGTGLPNDVEWAGEALTVGNLVGDSRILHVFDATDLSGNGDFGFGGLVSITDLSNMTLGTGSGTTGTDLAFYWFPGITTSGATVAEGQSFGSFRSDIVDTIAGSQMSFNVPSDAGTFNLYTLDDTLGGSYPATGFQANSVAGVPEPSRLMLLGLGLVGVMFRRRR